MGNVLGFLSKNIKMPGVGGGNYNNVVAPTSGIYRAAQAKLDAAITKLAGLETQKNTAIGNLNTYQATYKPLADEVLINSAAPNPAIDKIVLQEKYGNPNSPYWGNDPGNLKGSIPGAYLFSQGTWEDMVFNSGLSGGGAAKGSQVWLVQHWRENKYLNKVRELEGKVESVNKQIDHQQQLIIKLEKNRDEALAADIAASQQRERENMSDPAYIAAQAAREQKKAIQRNILILGAAAILVFGGAWAFRSR